jgi:transcriptional regulator with XRE-family HTH domain
VPTRTQTPFGDHLDQILRKRGLSVRAFARLVGVDVGSISSAKRKTMSQERMIAWANALGLEKDERVRFFDLASLTHAPPYLRERLDGLIAENERLREKCARRQLRSR